MGHNRGRTTKRRQMIVAELTKAEKNKRRSDGRKRKPEMHAWEDRVFDDWSVTAEPPTVPLAKVEHHDDEVMDDQVVA